MDRKAATYKVLGGVFRDSALPGERLRKELVTMVPDDDYNEDSDDTDDLIDDDESMEEPEEPGRARRVLGSFSFGANTTPCRYLIRFYKKDKVSGRARAKA